MQVHPPHKPTTFNNVGIWEMHSRPLGFLSGSEVEAAVGAAVQLCICRERERERGMSEDVK